MKDKFKLIITLITISIFLFISVGYALYGAKVTSTGSVYFGKNGEVAIVNVNLTDNSNLLNPENPSFTKDSISFNLNFRVESNSNLADDYYAEYNVTISNTSFYDYVFASSVFTPSIETSTNENMETSFVIEGIELGETIPKLTEKTFTLRINMYPKTTGDFNVSGNSDVSLQEEENEETGSLLASIPKNSEVNLRGNTVRDKVVLTVINSYEEAKNFSLSINNSNFKLVNISGNDLTTLDIAANSTVNYDIYIERKDGVSFATDSQNVNLTFNKTGGNSSLGTVKVLVDKDETLLDSEPPVISDVNATFVSENGKVNVSWGSTDVSEIDHYIIEVLDDSDTVIDTITTPNNNTSYVVSGLSNGTYYFKVYGVDNKDNNGKTNSTSCTTESGYCSRSTSSSYKWVFSVTYNLQNVTKSSGPDTITINETLTAKIQASALYSLPNSITVSMGGRTITSGYTYSNNNGNITIPNVTGDIVITANGTFSCLIEGTKVLLANGKYKNIENVNYNDLLSVWDYENGKITYEYPIWIEKTKKTKLYQKTTFSDGSELNTLGYHGVFSVKDNEFISVDDYSKFKVGTEVYKIINGKLKKVSVTKIEIINENINYYHVVSSRFYNIIANDFLTTDGTVILSNLYGFKDNIKWNSDIRNKVLKNNVYSYDDFKDIMPYYMFSGLRVEEGAYLQKFGLNKELFRGYLMLNQLNKDMLLEVDKNKNNKRVWMVTTDNDNVINYKDYLYEEGSYYVLPKVFGVSMWYSTSEDKYYKPYEKVKVNHSMHFVGN